MVRREADDPAGAAGGLQLQQGILLAGGGRGVLHQGGEVVGKDEGAPIVGVHVAGDALVARAEEAVGIVGPGSAPGSPSRPGLPGRLACGETSTYWPVSLVETAVGVINRVEHHHSSQ